MKNKLIKRDRNFLKLLICLFGFNIVLMAEFTRSVEGIVTDKDTGLQWQDDYSDNNDSVKKLAWEEAIDYCETLTLGEYNNWRLPNIRELNSLTDLNHHSPAVDPIFHYTVLDTTYWSATTYTSYPYNAWLINFDDGSRNNLRKTISYYIRCVRSQ